MMSDIRSFRHAPPRAGALIETLRGLGYSMPTAIADIIDNSISAKANAIDVRFAWRGTDSVVVIQDDGHGMDDAELYSAMRLGGKSPLDNRGASDLGRFGIGLKTASFSQCRRLTVASIRQGRELACLCWDLDVLAASPDDGWRLLEGPDDSSGELLTPLYATKSGTLVLWERLDRVVTSGFGEKDFLDAIDDVERYLAMVFHRYISGSRPPVHIRLNGQSLKPWDPFLSNHPATWTSPLESLAAPGGPIEVQGHVLPHTDRIAAKDQSSAAGPDGWTAQQGFYVYRNRRLVVAGNWLGLGLGRLWTKEEAHRLARIRLDIRNSGDTDWKIDIRKSIARPPVQIRSKLIKIAEDVRRRARRVFAQKGRPIRLNDQGSISEVWFTEHSGSGRRYRIDPTHPAVSAVLDDAGPLTPKIQAMLRIIEETIPIQRIWLDTTERQDTPQTGPAEVSSADIRSALEVLFDDMTTRGGSSPSLAKERLLRTEPFQNYQDLVASLPD